MSIDITVILAYIIGILLFFMLGRLFLLPMKILLKLVYNIILGGLALIVINLVGSSFQFHISFNPVSALIAGLLGIPGVGLLVVLKFLLAI